MHSIPGSHRSVRPWALLLAAVAARADLPPSADARAATATAATPAASLEPVTEPSPVQIAIASDPALSPAPTPIAVPPAAPDAVPVADPARPAPSSPSEAAASAAAANPFATVHWDRPPDFEPPAARRFDATGALTDEGEASWYGADFAGLPTASGEIFDMHAFTVAHPSWPLGSVIRVHNLENDRSVLARVNDRGPYARGRIVDCSLAIARALGFTGQGIAMVRITLLDSLPDAWTRFTDLAAPATFATPAFSDLLQRRHATRDAAVLALTEDTAPRLPLAMNAAIDTAVSERTAFRTASVLPFPAILHAWQHVSRWLLGPAGAPSRWRRLEHGLDAFGLRAVLRLFTQP